MINDENIFNMLIYISSFMKYLSNLLTIFYWADCPLMTNLQSSLIYSGHKSFVRFTY